MKHKSKILVSAGIVSFVVLTHLPACGSSNRDSTGAGGGVPTLMGSNASTDVDYSPANTSLGVYTYKYDNNRSGQYIAEPTLTTNLVSSNFGFKFRYSVQGYVYAQPLYDPGVSVNGSKGVVLIATEHDMVYAFDPNGAGADATGTVNSALWSANLAPPGETPVPSADVDVNDIQPEVGITGTPVIDSAKHILYVVAFTTDGTSHFRRLHALDLNTGKDVTPAAEISGTVAGNTFDPRIENQRSGLALINGSVLGTTDSQIIINFASHGDQNSYHGFVFAYDATTLQQTAAFTTTPNGGSEGGIWQGGTAPAVDVNGDIYFMVGNGAFTATNQTPGQVPDHQTNVSSFGDSAIRLRWNYQAGESPSSWFQVVDWFTPAGQNTLDEQDWDLGSGGLVLLPNQSQGSHPHLAVGGGKDGLLYVLDRDQMSQYNPGPSGNLVVDGVQLAGTDLNKDNPGIYGNPSYWNGHVYISSVAGPIYNLELMDNNGLMPLKTTTATFPTFPNPQLTVSAQGDQDGILWALEWESDASILHAYAANDLTSELWNSSKNAGDSAGPGVKFAVPVVANGHVYVGNVNQVTVYGQAH